MCLDWVCVLETRRTNRNGGIHPSVDRSRRGIHVCISTPGPPLPGVSTHKPWLPCLARTPCGLDCLTACCTRCSRGRFEASSNFQQGGEACSTRAPIRTPVPAYWGSAGRPHSLPRATQPNRSIGRHGRFSAPIGGRAFGQSIDYICMASSHHRLCMYLDCRRLSIPTSHYYTPLIHPSVHHTIDQPTFRTVNRQPTTTTVPATQPLTQQARMSDVKPDAGSEGTITLRVKDQTGEETLFKVRRAALYVSVCVVAENPVSWWFGGLWGLFCCGLGVSGCPNVAVARWPAAAPGHTGSTNR